MVLNSLFPVLALLLTGRILKHFNLTNEVFLKTSDRLIYYIFFPTLLFWKIGGAAAHDIAADWGFYTAALCAVLTIYLLSSLYVRLFHVSDYQAGAFSQSCYRFNTYIGVAIILTVLGEEGVRQFGVLIGLIIPIINALAVSTLTWFSGKHFGFRERSRLTARALVSNPLILACLSGITYARFMNGFPTFINNAPRLATLITLPLALLSIGGVLTFANLKYHLRLALIASIFKLLLLPVSGYFFLKLFGVSGIAFKVGIIFFTLPTSTALYVLSSQLNSDTELASASIALSTFLSFFSLSVALLL
ncbi:MAG: AEC family transporter [Desulfobacterales bacterium]|nr:MAG: AEC family transporter [Desulfobacterales bacterium]